MKTIKGVIFDMDNTLLQSNIDFQEMKNETFRFLTSHGVLSSDFDLRNQTTSTILQAAIETKRMSDELLTAMWEIPKKYEVIGMAGAKLEPGVCQLLHKLYRKYHLVVVTNNALEAAKTALEDNQIIQYFDLVVGRESMNTLKPSADGYLYVLNHHTSTSADQWLSVGDSWIDGKASNDAGITFIAYQGDIQKMNQMGVYPYGMITNIREILDFL